MDTLTGIKVFRQVVESGSFVAAAERLDVSTANVSKHVMHIEKRLGVRLLNRNSRTLSLTEPGRVYFERCKTILDDLEETELELGSLNSAPRGTLRITAPSWFAGQALGEFLADYRRRFPEIVLDWSFDDRFVDIVAEGYDLALRCTGAELPAGLIARRLRSVRHLIAASHSYLDQHGTPRSPAELASHDLVGVGDFDTWTLNGVDGAIDVPVRAVVRFRSLAGVAQCHRCRRRHRAAAGGLFRGSSFPRRTDARAPGLLHTKPDAVRGVREPQVHPAQDSLFHRSPARLRQVPHVLRRNWRVTIECVGDYDAWPLTALTAPSTSEGAAPDSNRERGSG